MFRELHITPGLRREKQAERQDLKRSTFRLVRTAPLYGVVLGRSKLELVAPTPQYPLTSKENEVLLNRLLEAKLQLLTAYETMVNKGTWVSWPDGNQYFVIKPEDFRDLLEPSERVDEAEAQEEEGRRARMPPFFEPRR